MIRYSVKSSNISTIGYDPQTQNLEIEFKGGTVWTYHDVSESTYNSLMNADSVGGYFQKHIRNEYKATKGVVEE